MGYGGYQLIDLKGMEIGEEEVYVPGAHDLIKNTIKPIVFHNFKVYGVQYHDTIATKVEPSGSDYMCFLGKELNNIYITTDDIVSFGEE